MEGTATLDGEGTQATTPSIVVPAYSKLDSPTSPQIDQLPVDSTTAKQGSDEEPVGVTEQENRGSPIMGETITTEQVKPALTERSSYNSETDTPPLAPAVVFGVCLVGFDHAVGPTVEFCHPPQLNADGKLMDIHLPFFALPDGAHARVEDYSYFHLQLPSVYPNTIFGISCNRQIQSTELINRGKDVTRSTVQKAIVVLASQPIFGALRDKLGLITRAFFEQKDFADKSILVELYNSLEIPNDPAAVHPGSKGEEGGIYMGTALRELIHKFRFKTLMLLKLILLQKKIMFYASPQTSVESLCSFQYSLVALIPALLTHLEDSALPSLNERITNIPKSSSLKTSDKRSLIRYLGLPLNIFGQGAFFQPYLPLQQIELLKCDTYLVGTTNSIFQQQKDASIDVLVNLDTGTLDILNTKLNSVISLTPQDRKWMDEIVATVDSSYSAEDPSRPATMSFVGSEDFIRAKFEEYVCSLLACLKCTDYMATHDRRSMLLSNSELDPNILTSFNENFVNSFRKTAAYSLWNKTTDDVIFDLVEPRHPMEGKTNPLEDVGIRLAHGLHELRLEDNLGPTRDAITKGFEAGSESLWKTYTNLRSDLGKRQSEWERRRTSPTPNLKDNAVASTVLAGVDGAKTGANMLATGIGSFISNSRKSLFAPREALPESERLYEAGDMRENEGTEIGGRSSAGYPPLSVNKAEKPGSFLRPLSLSLASTFPLHSDAEPRTPERKTNPVVSNVAQGAANIFGVFKKLAISEPAPAAKRERLPTPPWAVKEEEEVEFKIRDLDAEYKEREAGKNNAVLPKKKDELLEEAVEYPPSDSVVV